MLLNLFRTFCLLLFGAVLAGAAMLLPIPLRAQVVLKPNGQNAVPLRVKSLSVDTHIDRQFATSKLTLNFQNETGQRIEADFLYTLPPNTLVTGFAYWYGNEKVAARVVEKERAATIYAYITARMRDPALIEMVGKNTFRARIFPILPNADLKVEMQLVQALPSDAQGAVYALPLPTQRGQQLDALDIRVRVPITNGVDRVLNNWGLPVTRENGLFDFHISGANYRPVKDLRVTMTRPVLPLHAELLAARSGGPDGFFALALTPDHSLHAPEVRIAGVSAYQVLPSRLPDVKANQSLLVVGRYRGSGAAIVTLTGQGQDGRRTYAQRVVFGNELIANNLASKLWAARQIEQLSAGNANRNAVLTLSLRHTLPSKYTSWLAIPKAELERYAREKAEADMNVIANQLAHRMAEGEGNTSEARQLRLQLAAACKQTGYFPEERTRFALESAMNQLFYALQDAKQHGASAHQISDWQTQMHRLSVLTGLPTAPVARQVYHDKLYRNAITVSQRLTQEIGAGRPYSSEAKKQRLALSRLRKLLGTNSLYPLSDALWQEQYRIAQAWLKEVQEGRGNGDKAQALRAGLRPLAWLFGTNPANQAPALLGARLSELATEIVAERHREHGNDAKIAQWETEYQQLKTQFDPDFADTYMLQAEAYWELRQAEPFSQQSNEEQKKPNPDKQRIADLRAQAEAHYKVYKAKIEIYSTAYYGYYRKQANRQVTSEDIEAAFAHPQTVSDRNQLLALRGLREDLRRYEMETRARGGDPLIQVEAPVDAVNVVALMPDGDIKRLAYNAANKKWEARFDIPMYAKEGAYVVQIIIVLKDGTRQQIVMRYHVDTTPPKAAGTAQVTANAGEPTLRLEVEADADTARVTALLPWGEQTPLKPSAERNHFFALVPIPLAQRGTSAAVTYIVTDKAHNRTVITVDMKP